jgi:hypothetical protein
MVHVRPAPNKPATRPTTPPPTDLRARAALLAEEHHRRSAARGCGWTGDGPAPEQIGARGGRR